MKDYINEIVQFIYGNRKGGVDYSYSLRIENIILPSSFNKKTISVTDGVASLAYENFRNQDQKDTPHCVAFAIAHWLSFYLTRKYGERITIEGRYIAKLLIDAGILTSRGARLDRSCGFVSNSKEIHDTNFKYYNVGKVQMFSRKLIPEILKKGYPLITGASVAFPMLGKDYYMKADGSNPHAFLLVPSRYTAIFAENSWKNFGIPYHSGGLRSGQFKIHNEDLEELFTPMLFESVVRID